MSRFLLALCCLFAVSFSTTFAFTPDNRLLNTLYDKIDSVYNTSPQKVLHAYHALPYAKIRVSNKPELLYYLDKLEAYIHGKLFTFIEQPNFVCLDTYVQKNDTVEAAYTITNVADGSLIVTTLEALAREVGIPASQVVNNIAFNAGKEQVLPGMDKLVLGAQLQKRTAAVLEPKDAYGVYTESKRITFTWTLDPVIQISNVWERIMMKITVDGEEKLLMGSIIEKTSTSATIDFNHPHAWETVLLSLEVMSVFKACGR